jgi:competence protein ComEC
MRHYLLIALAAAVLTGLAASELFSFLPLVTCLLLLALAFVRPRAGAFSHILYAVVLVAVLYGQFRYWHVPVDDVSHFAGQRLALTATVAELPSAEPDRTVFMARAESVALNGRSVPVSGRVRVSRYGGKAPALAYGDRFTATVNLRPVTSLRNPGGLDYAALMGRRGVRTRATLPRAGPVAVTRAPPGVLTAVNGWRARVREAAAAALPPEAAGLLTALTVGDGRGLPESVRARFQGAGVAHLLAVSGTHLGLVAGLVLALAMAAFRRVPARWLTPLAGRVQLRWAAGVAALVAVSLYAALAGARTPTLRALVMVWMVTLALLLGRQAHAPTALALAALGVLAWDPRAVGEASFQLSFMAVLAILLVTGRLGRPTGPDGGPPSRWDRAKRYAAALVAVTLAAGLATAPLVAWHFGQVAWPGFFANLLLVPVTGLVVLPVSLLAAVPAPALGGLPFPHVVGAVLTGFLHAVGWFANLPGALARVPAPPVALVAATYAAPAVLWVLWRRWKGAEGPVTRGTLAAVAGTLAVAGILSVGWGISLHPAPPTGSLRVALLDVGQGDSAVVVGPRGDALVIDGGTRFGRFDTGRLAVAPYLRSLGVTRVSLLASHPQADHAGGLIHLVGAFHPRAVYTNGVRRADAGFDNDFHAALAAAGLAPTVLRRGSPFAPLAGVAARVLGPVGTAGAPGGRGVLNNASLVVRLGYGRHAFLFTGDIEASAERSLAASGQDLSATVLKVPHHGSAGSSTAPFLARVAPRVAVISAGRYNPYHHPSPRVEASFRRRGVPVAETARDGAVLFATDGRTLKTATWADLAPARIPPWTAAPRAAEARNLARLLAPERLWRTVDTAGPADSGGSPFFPVGYSNRTDNIGY